MTRWIEYADPVAAWITGPMVKAMLVLALCLGLLAVAHWMLRRIARQWQKRVRSEGELGRGDRLAVGLIVGLATVFVLVAFTMSAATLHDSATWLKDTPVPVNGGDLRILFPLVLDGLIVLFLALDLWTEWRGMRHPYYRWVAYGLSALTLYLNVSHGDGGSLLGHAAPPLGVIVISEGLAIWIRSMARMIDTGKHTDRVPMGHWIARPASAWRVWRLMLGWHIDSYETAVEMERRRSMAYAMLAEQYGPKWRTETPRHLRWMLDNGSELDAAYAIIRAMTRERVAMTPEEVERVARGVSASAIEERSLPVSGGDERSIEPASGSAPAVEASGPGERASGEGDDSPLSDDLLASVMRSWEPLALTAPELGDERPVSDERDDERADETPEERSVSERESAAEGRAERARERKERSAVAGGSDRERALAMWLADRSLTGAELARSLGKSAATGSRWRREFEREYGASEREK